jgi:hypothetical protein
MATKLEALLGTGELQKAARGAKSWNDVERALGWGVGTLKHQRARIRAGGRPFPELAELTGSAPPESRWPNVEAFDRGDPPLPAIPEGHTVRGVSTLVGPDGETKGQWIKTSAADRGREEMLDAIRKLGEAMPRIPAAPAPIDTAADLLCVYAVGDPHIGMLAWHEDAGESFDLDIAEARLTTAIDTLVTGAPPAGEALLVLIGDNTHSDGQHNTTTKGTRVDVDGRTAKMMRVAVRTCRRSIDRILEKHARCTVIVERGNHDELLSLMLAMGLSLAYEHESRVTIDTSPEMFHWFRFGKVLIGTHHGHNAKPMDLLGVMAVDRAHEWSETEHRRFYCGHYHHIMTKEVPGLVVDYLPTLASSDAWHRSMGYRSQRAMYMDVFHREEGHKNRHIVGVQRG